MLRQYCLAWHCNTCVPGVYQLGLISKTCTIISSIYQVFNKMLIPTTYNTVLYSVHTTIQYSDVFKCSSRSYRTWPSLL